MARIAGVNIPTGKRVPIALTYITGIGSHIAEQICEANNIDRARRVNDLTDAEVLAIREYIDANLTVEGDLRREVATNIKRLMDLGSYRGLRHRRNLPVRGQRTHTNARTVPWFHLGPWLTNLDQICRQESEAQRSKPP